MDTRKRKEGDRDDRPYLGGETGDLLRLFSSLGVTVAAGILGFFLLGLWLDRKLGDMGWRTYGLPRIALLLLGLALTIYWAYMRIARHLDKYEKRDGEKEEGEEEDFGGD